MIKTTLTLLATATLCYGNLGFTHKQMDAKYKGHVSLVPKARKMLIKKYGNKKTTDVQAYVMFPHDPKSPVIFAIYAGDKVEWETYAMSNVSVSNDLIVVLAKEQFGNDAKVTRAGDEKPDKKDIDKAFTTWDVNGKYYIVFEAGTNMIHVFTQKDDKKVTK